MEKSTIIQLARMLKILVSLTFFLNVLILPVIPLLVVVGQSGAESFQRLRAFPGLSFLLWGGLHAWTLVRVIWGLFYYRSAAPLFTYNALFVPLFLMGGLLCMVMSALFRQAAALKEENDFTI